MASENPNIGCRVAPSVASRSSILRVWHIVNAHFESLLTRAEGSTTKSRAEINIQCQVKELRDLMGTCSSRLKTIESYISELQKQDTGAQNNCQLRQRSSSDLTGEWHFLYMEDNSVFGYMQLVPETVSVTSDPGHGKGSTFVKRAEFTIPAAVMREANETLCHEDASQADRSCEYALCPCCQITFKSSEFWKHALFEISERGNRVPAWQSLDRSDTPRWIVDRGAGWSNPIYRPRGLHSTCEIGQSFAELNLNHFLSDSDFSRALDSTFDFLALQLRT